MSQLFAGYKHSKLYSKFRLLPPSSLIQDIISFLKMKVKPPFQNAVDVGCGSGQSTIVLAPYFHNVCGVDPSAAQIENAKQKHIAANVYYRVGSAEKLEFADSSIDLVTSSQSFHWFDTSKAFKEIDRVLIPNGVLAIYSYWIPFPKLENDSKTKQLKQVVMHLYADILRKYFHPNRCHIENRYADISLPFKDSIRKNYNAESISTVSDYIGYLSTWSGYQTLYKEDSQKATGVLEETQQRIMEIMNVTNPEITTLPLQTEYFMLLGRK